MCPHQPANRPDTPMRHQNSPITPYHSRLRNFHPPRPHADPLFRHSLTVLADYETTFAPPLRCANLAKIETLVSGALASGIQ